MGLGLLVVIPLALMKIHTHCPPPSASDTETLDPRELELPQTSHGGALVVAGEQGPQMAALT